MNFRKFFCNKSLVTLINIDYFELTISFKFKTNLTFFLESMNPISFLNTKIPVLRYFFDLKEVIKAVTGNYFFEKKNFISIKIRK